MQDIINNVDIYIQSSLDESFPNIIAESMLYYTPCVATDVGDTNLIISDFGWLCKINKTDLADKILLAYNYKKNGEKWKKLQSACNKHIHTTFSIYKTVEEHNKIWIK